MEQEKYKDYAICILKDCDTEWYKLPQDKTMRQIKRHIDEFREANKRYGLHICIWLAKKNKREEEWEEVY